MSSILCSVIIDRPHAISWAAPGESYRGVWLKEFKEQNCPVCAPSLHGSGAWFCPHSSLLRNYYCDFGPPRVPGFSLFPFAPWRIRWQSLAACILLLEVGSRHLRQLPRRQHARHLPRVGLM